MFFYLASGLRFVISAREARCAAGARLDGLNPTVPKTPRAPSEDALPSQQQFALRPDKQMKIIWGLAFLAGIVIF
jgi:hypothetical protein